MRARTTFLGNSKNAREPIHPVFRIFKAASVQHLTAILFPILHLVSPEPNYCIIFSISLSLLESIMPAQRRSESTISTGTTRWNLKADQLSVHSCILLIVAWICCLLSITQKKVQVTRPCHICGSLRVLSRNADLKRHMKTHDSDPTKFVLLFSNLLIIVIDTYLIGNSRVHMGWLHLPNSSEVQSGNSQTSAVCTIIIH